MSKNIRHVFENSVAFRRSESYAKELIFFRILEHLKLVLGILELINSF